MPTEWLCYVLLQKLSRNTTCLSVALCGAVGRYHHRPCADDKNEAAEVPENHIANLLGHDLNKMSHGVQCAVISYGIL